VEKLTDLGISATDVKKLKEAGYHTVESLFMRPKKVCRSLAMHLQCLPLSALHLLRLVSTRRTSSL